MTLNQAISLRINEYLRKNSLTQKELAEKAQISYYTLKSLVRSSENGANVLTLIYICHALGVSLSEFLDTPLFIEDNLNL